MSLTQTHADASAEESAEATSVRVAVDIGGTTIKGASFTSDGAVVNRCTATTFGTDDALTSLRSVIRNLTESAKDSGRDVAGIGIASPGLVDATRGRIIYAANLGWDDLGIVEILHDEFGLSAHIEHDARAGAIAERAAHTDEPDAYLDFIFVPIGTGVAAAVVTSGLLVHGATGGAGEFGHMPIVPGGEVCGCGQRGCIEAYASASSVLQRYFSRGGTAAVQTPDLVQLLDADADAAAVWGDLIEALSLGLSSLTAVLDPARIVIGGGLSQAGQPLLEPLRAAVDAKLGWRPTPPIVQSALGSHAGLIGAAIISAEQTVPRTFATTAASHLSAADTSLITTRIGGHD